MSRKNSDGQFMGLPTSIINKNKKLSFLVIEDEEYIREDLIQHILKYGHVDYAGDRKQAERLLSENHYDIVFIDLMIQGEYEGFCLLNLTHQKGFYSVILSAYGRESDFVVKAEKLGCRDFLSKPHTQEGIDLVIERYRKEEFPESVRDFIRKKYITRDKLTIESLNVIENIYNSDIAVLISGPSGTGKRVVAEIIHDLKYYNRDKFININCAEFSESLLESELFGYTKGAFTGANEDRMGRLKAADGGTLFLDEIGAMPLSMQNKLIKAIEEKVFTPVGSTKQVRSNFRLIAATSSDLYEMVEKMQFRLDLLYRINASQIVLSSLSERKEDIIPLIENAINNLKSRRAIVVTEEAKKCLISYDWHGNVRELEGLVREWDNKGLLVVYQKHLPGNILKNKNPFKKKSFKYINKEQLDMVKEMGLLQFLEKLKEEVILYYFDLYQSGLSFQVT